VTSPDASSNTYVPVARGDEVRPGPVAVRVRDTALVVFRDRQGQVGALVDRCPHRDVPLSKGSVGWFGELLCDYHGWGFDTGGACVQMPMAHATMPRSRACVRSFPVREVDGFVWVALDGADGSVA